MKSEPTHPPEMENDPLEILREGLLALSLEPSQEVIGAFATYMAELLRWNRVHNLTGVTDEVQIVQKHFLDSLLFLRAIPDEFTNILDVGSGAGFPGVPMKIVRPGLNLTLLEPRKKRAAFLRHLTTTLMLRDIRIADIRIEEFSAEKTAKFDAAVVRALFTAGEFVRLVSPLVKEGGLMVLSKGKEYEAELVLPGSISYTVTGTVIPHTDVSRYLITVRN